MPRAAPPAPTKAMRGGRPLGGAGVDEPPPGPGAFLLEMLRSMPRLRDGVCVMDKPPARPFPDDVEAAFRFRAKKEMRATMQRMRSATPASARALRSEAIRARLLAMSIYDGATSIALFHPIEKKGEVDLGGVDRDARARGLRVAYPALHESPPSRTMSFRWIDLEDDPVHSALEDRGHGFLEPRDDAPVAAVDHLDVIIVPGLAFDPTGHRLGYGAGFYDMTLEGASRARTIGVAFDFQIVSEIPVTPGDVPVQTVVTDRRTFVRPK
jgi:5-formyltetrahydrofolate cyclo-ligase